MVTPGGSARRLHDDWAPYTPPHTTAHADTFDGYYADCPTPGCGRLIFWTATPGSKFADPGPCDCEIEESA